MSYEKQTFIDNETVLRAEHLNHIEDGIETVDVRANVKIVYQSNFENWVKSLKSIGFCIVREDFNYSFMYSDVEYSGEMHQGDMYSFSPSTMELKFYFNTCCGDNLNSDTSSTHVVSFLDTAAKTEGCYSRWSTSSNMLKTSASDAWNTYRGAVTEGDEWNIKAYSVGDAYAVFFLNSTGGLVSTIPTTAPSSAMVVDEIITVPSGAVEMIVNEEILNSVNYGLNGVVVEKTIATSDSGSLTINNHLYGKVLLACGDSITDAYDLSANDGSYLESYAELTANRNGMIFKKDAVSGSTIAYNASGDTSISTEAFSNTRYTNLPEFDYLTIWFGWNDGAYSTLGTIEDIDNTTFYGAYKKVLEYLVTNNPTKKIGIIVPNLKPSRSLIAPNDMATAVREISKLYGVPCLDLHDYNQCSGLWGEANAVQQARNTALTFDGTHPNQDGHKFLSTIYEEFRFHFPQLPSDLLEVLP